jgi:hypothetical protein
MPAEPSTQRTIRFVETLKWAASKADDMVMLLEQSTDQAVRLKIQGEERVLRSRLEFMKCVLSEDEKKLAELISKTKNDGAMGATTKAGGAGSVASRAAIGYAPPCASFELLQTVLALTLMAEEYKDAASEDDIKATNLKMAAARKPMRELAASVQDATKELNAARELALKPPQASGAKGKSKAKAAKGRGKAGRGGAGESIPDSGPQGQCMLLELAPDIGRRMPTERLPDGQFDDSAVTYDEPRAVRGEAIAKLITEDKGIQALLSTFISDFSKCEARKKAVVEASVARPRTRRQFARETSLVACFPASRPMERATS